MLTLDVSDIRASFPLIVKLRELYSNKHKVSTFVPFKIVDGGNANQIILFIGFNNFADYGKSERIQEEISEIEESLRTNVVRSVTSETLRYSAEMSLFPERK